MKKNKKKSKNVWTLKFASGFIDFPNDLLHSLWLKGIREDF